MDYGLIEELMGELGGEMQPTQGDFASRLGGGEAAPTNMGGMVDGMGSMGSADATDDVGGGEGGGMMEGLTGGGGGGKEEEPEYNGYADINNSSQKLQQRLAALRGQ